MKTEQPIFKTIPGFSKYEMNAAGQIRNRSTLELVKHRPNKPDLYQLRNDEKKNRDVRPSKLFAVLFTATTDRVSAPPRRAGVVSRKAPVEHPGRVRKEEKPVKPDNKPFGGNKKFVPSGYVTLKELEKQAKAGKVSQTDLKGAIAVDKKLRDMPTTTGRKVAGVNDISKEAKLVLKSNGSVHQKVYMLIARCGLTYLGAGKALKIDGDDRKITNVVSGIYLRHKRNNDKVFVANDLFEQITGPAFHNPNKKHDAQPAELVR